LVYWVHLLFPLSLPEVQNQLRHQFLLSLPEVHGPLRSWQDQLSPGAMESSLWVFFEDENPAYWWKWWKDFLLSLIQAPGLPAALDVVSVKPLGP